MILPDALLEEIKRGESLHATFSALAFNDPDACLPGMPDTIEALAAALAAARSAAQGGSVVSRMLRAYLTLKAITRPEHPAAQPGGVAP